MVMADISSGSLQQVLKSDSKVFKGIFVVSFSVLLLFALFASVLPWQWRTWLPGAESEKSLIGGVKAAVYTFMSYLT
jgi:light-harvesting complex 1 beta chain